MLSVFEKGILELIRCSIKGGIPKIEDGFDFENSFLFAQERQIAPLIYYGAVNLDGFMDTLAGKKFLKSTMKMSFYCDEQMQIIKSVSEAFKQENICHMMVKGTILREMYPYPEMRLMSDADILIKEKEYPKIKQIMVSLGFVEEYESDHEYVWKKQDTVIELHKRLVPSYNKDYYRYFGDGWNLATRVDEKTGECFMSDEDNFIYNFVHYAMHYRNGGIGVKHVTDFYVIMERNTNLDFSYIEGELKKLQLLEFWKNTKKLLDVWFFEAEPTELTDFMTKRIFDSGAYGTAEQRANSEAVRTGNTGKNVKLKKALRIAFPPYSGMKQKYRILKKLPILLPFMWVVRWIAVIFKPSKIKKQKETLDMISSDSVNKYQSELDYVGLRFNFE